MTKLKYVRNRTKKVPPEAGYGYIVAMAVALSMVNDILYFRNTSNITQTILFRQRVWGKLHSLVLYSMIF